MPRRTWPLVVAVAACVTFPRPATADATDECINESEAGQKLFLLRHFVESRSHLIACGRAQCPAILVRDCAERLRQADASTATVLLSGKLTDGSDVSELRVFVDESAVPYRPRGDALPVDPGSHTFRFERADGSRVTRQLTIAEGTRLQHVSVTFDSPVAPRAEVSPSPRRSAGIIVGAVGLVSLAAGAVLVGVAEAEKSSEASACPPSNCPSAQHSRAETDYHTAVATATASTVAFAGGAVLAATGATLWLTTPKPGAGVEALGLIPTVARGGIGLCLTGAF